MQHHGGFTLQCEYFHKILWICLTYRCCRYNGAKKHWAKQFGDNGDLESVQKLGPMAHIACATIAGWTTSLCTNPIWVIKTRMQIQMYKNPDNYTGVARASLILLISSYLPPFRCFPYCMERRRHQRVI